MVIWGLLNVSGSKMQFFRIGQGADNPDGDGCRDYGDRHFYCPAKRSDENAFVDDFFTLKSKDIKT